jgi:hypothetical protein
VKRGATVAWRDSVWCVTHLGERTVNLREVVAGSAVPLGAVGVPIGALRPHRGGPVVTACVVCEERMRVGTSVAKKVDVCGETCRADMRARWKGAAQKGVGL